MTDLRRVATLLALPALAATALTACSPAPVAHSPSTSAAQTQPAAPSTSADPTDTDTPSSSATGAPTPTAINDPAADMSGLKAAADKYAELIGNRDFKGAAALVCPGVRGASADAWAKSQLSTPSMYLQFAEVNPRGYADAFAQGEFRDPGVKTTSTAAVLFDVTPGSEYPNPDLLTRWVLSDAGWQFCGSAPNA